MNKDQHSNNSPFVKFLKKIGWIGFFFFLLKGIAWLVFGYVGFSFFNSCN